MLAGPRVKRTLHPMPWSLVVLCACASAPSPEAQVPEPAVPVASPASEPPADQEPVPVPPVSLHLAHALPDGRVFVELGEAPPADAATPLCGPPQCDFQLWMGAPRAEPPPIRVIVVDPLGRFCEGDISDRRTFAVLDPFAHERPPEALEAARWAEGVVVTGCGVGAPLFLFAVVPPREVEPRAHHVAGGDAELTAEPAAVFGGAPEAEVWRFGEVGYVRVRACADAPSGSCHDPDEAWFAYGAGGEPIEDHGLPRLEDTPGCCEMVTGLVDVDGDGRPDRIHHSKYPEDAEWVWLTVTASTGVRLHVQLASEY